MRVEGGQHINARTQYREAMVFLPYDIIFYLPNLHENCERHIALLQSPSGMRQWKTLETTLNIGVWIEAECLMIALVGCTSFLLPPTILHSPQQPPPLQEPGQGIVY